MRFNRPMLVLCALLAAASAVSASAAEESSAEGFWVMKGFVVHITRCGGGLCGELVGLSESKRPDALRLDARNSDPGKRARPLCGIDVFGDFQPSGREAGKWQGGWIYNPEDGHTYSSEMRVEGPDILKARGYLLVPLFGRNITLIRESALGSRCAQELAGEL